MGLKTYFEIGAWLILDHAKLVMWTPFEVNYLKLYILYHTAWWRHQMETFSALLALCAGNSPVTKVSQRPATRSFDVFFDLPMNKRMSE